jgi:hypothetical protein
MDNLELNRGRVFVLSSVHLERTTEGGAKARAHGATAAVTTIKARDTVFMVVNIYVGYLFKILGVNL